MALEQRSISKTYKDIQPTIMFLERFYTDHRPVDQNTGGPTIKNNMIFARQLEQEGFGALGLQAALLYPIFLIASGQERDLIKSEMESQFGAALTNGAQCIAELERSNISLSIEDRLSVTRAGVYIVWQYIERPESNLHRLDGTFTWSHMFGAVDILKECATDTAECLKGLFPNIDNNSKTAHVDAETQIIALLHDIVEDLHIPYDTISDLFGKSVSLGISKIGVVKKESPTKLDELLRDAELRAGLHESVVEQMRAVPPRYAERLHNQRTDEALKPDSAIKTAIETLEDYLPLAEALGMQWFIDQMSQQAFSRLFPRFMEERMTIFPAFDSDYQHKIAINVVQILGLETALESGIIIIKPPSLADLWRVLRSKTNLEEIIEVITSGQNDTQFIKNKIHPNEIPFSIIIPASDVFEAWHHLGKLRLRDGYTAVHTDKLDAEIDARRDDAHIIQQFLTTDGKSTSFIVDLPTKSQQIMKTVSLMHPLLVGIELDPLIRKAIKKKVDGIERDLAEIQGTMVNTPYREQIYKANLEGTLMHLSVVVNGRAITVEVIQGATALDVAASALKKDVIYCETVKLNGKPISLHEAIPIGGKVDIVLSETKKLTPWWLGFTKHMDPEIIEYMKQTLQQTMEAYDIELYDKSSPDWEEEKVFQQNTIRHSEERGIELMEFWFTEKTGVQINLRISRVFNQVLSDYYESVQDFFHDVGIDRADPDLIRQTLEHLTQVLETISDVAVYVPDGQDQPGWLNACTKLLEDYGINIVAVKSRETNIPGISHIMQFWLEEPNVDTIIEGKLVKLIDNMRTVCETKYALEAPPTILLTPPSIVTK